MISRRGRIVPAIATPQNEGMIMTEAPLRRLCRASRRTGDGDHHMDRGCGGARSSGRRRRTTGSPAWWWAATSVAKRTAGPGVSCPATRTTPDGGSDCGPEDPGRLRQAADGQQPLFVTTGKSDRKPWRILTTDAAIDGY